MPTCVPEPDVRDRLALRTELVSVNPQGRAGNREGSFGDPSISGDGRFVAFASFSSDLVAGDTNFLEDLFVRDRTENVTVRASVSSAGAQATNSSFDGTLSTDGRYVAFWSFARNLV